MKDLTPITPFRQEHVCAENLDIRLRPFQGTEKQHFVYQCLVCGRQNKGAITEAMARSLLTGREPVMFDFNIETGITSKCRAIAQRLAEIRDELTPGTRQYSEEMNQQRIDSGERDRSIVEGALAKLLESHSKTHAIDVALRNLLVLRKEVRAEQTVVVNRFSTEEELKAWVQPHLGKVCTTPATALVER